MAGILHPQPYAIHLLKKNPDCFFPFCLVCLHLLYCVFLLFADPFPQLLDQVPDTSMADCLPTSITYHICADTIRGFRYCQGNLLCKVRRDQPDLLHLHRLIQKVYIGSPAVLLFCPVNSPGVCGFPIYRFDRGFPFPFFPVRFCISFFRQLIIIVFQNDLSDQPSNSQT